MFDLDTKALEKYYPTKNWRNAYEDIKKHMLDNGFEWQQGSGYHSKEGINLSKVDAIIDAMAEKQPWLHLAVRDMQVGDLPKLHSLNKNFDKNFEMPSREALQKEKPSLLAALKQNAEKAAQHNQARKAIKGKLKNEPDRQYNDGFR
ncbi:MAG: hypothetical protein FWG67_05890 [Defluviitaleaceae bacterium]|nr:hypothetical protein [Defluviitaleaceae bacterium]